MVGGIKMVSGDDHYKATPVSSYTKEGLLVKTYGSMVSAALDVGVSRYAIFNVVHGRSHTSCGLKWRFTNG